MILITGASGLVGSHLIEELLKRDPNKKIRALYNSTLPTNAVNHVEYVSCNLLNLQDVEDVMVGITHVFHCAAIVSFNPKDKNAIVENNEIATSNLVNTALENNVLRFIHVSSIATIGRQNKLNQQLTENDYWEDDKRNSQYSVSKYLSEMQVWRGFAEGLNGAIINPGIILGEGNWEKSSSKLMHTVAQGLKWYTNGTTSFVDVKDVVRAMIELMYSEINHERYIISCGNFSYQEIFSLMAKSLNVNGPNKLAKKWMSNILWRLYRIKEWVTNKPAVITKETAHTAHSFYQFDNTKFLKTFTDFQYQDIVKTISRMGKQYLIDNKIGE